MPHPDSTNRPIKVALVISTISHYRVPIYRTLHNKPDIHLHIFHGADIRGTKFSNATDTEGIEHSELWTFQSRLRSSGRDSHVTFNPSLPLVLWRYRPDVIITAGGGNIFNNLLVAAYVAITRTPVICWSLGMLKGRKYTGLARQYRKLVVWFEAFSDALLGYSTRAIQYFHDTGHPPEKCFLAVNCLDTDKIFSDIQRIQADVVPLRQRLGLDNKQVVLFVGAMESNKRLDRLVRAFRKAVSEVPSLHLLMVGDGSSRLETEDLIADLGIADKVSFTGRVVEDVATYFQLASVFVLPGLGGLAMIEAMAHGVPVICGTCDGTEEDYIVDGENGFRFDDQQSEEEVVQEISQQLVAIFSDKDTQQRLSDAARDRIMHTHNGTTYVNGIYSAICYAHRDGKRAGRRNS